MRAGKLRHRIAIEAPTGAQNEFGEPVDTWAVHSAVWASKEDLTGREAFAAQQVNAAVSTRFGVRFIEGINARMRIVHDGTLYNIVSASDPDGRKRELVIIAAREG